MYINSIAHYLPNRLVQNAYFEEINGLDDEYIYHRTGIRTRTKAEDHENTNTMSVEAVRKVSRNLPYPIESIDLIVGATYTPYDTVATLSHEVQHEFGIEDAKVVSISAACSSLINAIEIVEGYFAMNKATRAIVVASEHNSAYNDEHNILCGHLWGDGAAAIVISKEKHSPNDLEIKEIRTQGLGHIDKGLGAVYLRPQHGGIHMQDGKNVFINACKYMSSLTEEILEDNGFSLKQLSYLIPHQANQRIITNVAERLGITNDQTLSNIETCGNTGCASVAILLSENFSKFKQGDVIVAVVFGGGYSSGSMLLLN